MVMSVVCLLGVLLCLGPGNGLLPYNKQKYDSRHAVRRQIDLLPVGGVHPTSPAHTTHSRHAVRRQIDLLPVGGVHPTSPAHTTPIPPRKCFPNEYGAACVYCEPEDSCMFGHYTCDTRTGNRRCHTGWQGESCLKQVPTNNAEYHVTCPENECRNGGTCNSAGSCCCTLGFTGILCEVEIIECSNTSCENGGTCRDLIFGGYECICDEHYTGERCEHARIPERDSACQADTCLNNATCYEYEHVAYCVCPTWFTGKRCERSMLSSNASKINTCPLNKFGPHCEITCIPSDTCHDGHFVCHPMTGDKICIQGWTDTDCNIRVLPPILDTACPLAYTCENGGQCFNGSCCCAHAYSGESCANRTAVCGSEACQNGGSCIDNGDQYHCVCESSFTGKQCEHKTQHIFTSSTPGLITSSTITSETMVASHDSGLVTTKTPITMPSISISIKTTEIISSKAISTTTGTPVTISETRTKPLDSISIFSSTTGTPVTISETRTKPLDSISIFSSTTGTPVTISETGTKPIDSIAIFSSTTGTPVTISETITKPIDSIAKFSSSMMAPSSSTPRISHTKSLSIHSNYLSSSTHSINTTPVSLPIYSPIPDILTMSKLFISSIPSTLSSTSHKTSTEYMSSSEPFSMTPSSLSYSYTPPIPSYMSNKYSESVISGLSSATLSAIRSISSISLLREPSVSYHDSSIAYTSLKPSIGSVTLQPKTISHSSLSNLYSSAPTSSILMNEMSSNKMTQPNTITLPSVPLSEHTVSNTKTVHVTKASEFTSKTSQGTSIQPTTLLIPLAMNTVNTLVNGRSSNYLDSNTANSDTDTMSHFIKTSSSTVSVIPSRSTSQSFSISKGGTIYTTSTALHSINVSPIATLYSTESHVISTVSPSEVTFPITKHNTTSAIKSSLSMSQSQSTVNAQTFSVLPTLSSALITSSIPPPALSSSTSSSSSSSLLSATLPSLFMYLSPSSSITAAATTVSSSSLPTMFISSSSAALSSSLTSTSLFISSNLSSAPSTLSLSPTPIIPSASPSSSVLFLSTPSSSLSSLSMATSATATIKSSLASSTSSLSLQSLSSTIESSSLTALSLSKPLDTSSPVSTSVVFEGSSIHLQPSSTSTLTIIKSAQSSSKLSHHSQNIFSSILPSIALLNTLNSSAIMSTPISTNVVDSGLHIPLTTNIISATATMVTSGEPSAYTTTTSETLANSFAGTIPTPSYVPTQTKSSAFTTATTVKLANNFTSSCNFRPSSTSSHYSQSEVQANSMLSQLLEQLSSDSSIKYTIIPSTTALYYTSSSSTSLTPTRIALASTPGSSMASSVNQANLISSSTIASSYSIPLVSSAPPSPVDSTFAFTRSKSTITTSTISLTNLKVNETNSMSTAAVSLSTKTTSTHAVTQSTVSFIRSTPAKSTSNFEKTSLNSAATKSTMVSSTNSNLVKTTSTYGVTSSYSTGMASAGVSSSMIAPTSATSLYASVVMVTDQEGLVGKDTKNNHLPFEWWWIIVVIVGVSAFVLLVVFAVMVVLQQRRTDSRSLTRKPEDIQTYDKEHFSVQPEFINQVFDYTSESDDNESITHDIYIVNED